jgi:hypothetical protein
MCSQSVHVSNTASNLQGPLNTKHWTFKANKKVYSVCMHTWVCRHVQVDEPVGLQLCREPDLGAAGTQPQHTAAALRKRAALTYHTLHLQEGW